MNIVELLLAFSEYVVCLSVLLAILGIVFYWRFDSAVKAFVIFLIIGGAIDILTHTMSRFQNNNLYWMHMYTLLELVLLSGFFKVVFARMKLNIPIKTVTSIILILCILNTIFLQPLLSFNSNASMLVSMTIIVFSILTFYHLLDKGQIEYKLIKWIVSGLLLYQMTNFIILGSSNILIEYELEIDKMIWVLRICILLFTKLVFLYILFSAALTSRKSLAV